MNEKKKQILRYVACGLGGLALGIGLLGGLSMCATSNKTTAESVNTVYANPRRAQITTDEGGYTGYQVGFPVSFYDTPNTNGEARITIYKVSTTNYTKTQLSMTLVDLTDTYTGVQCDTIKTHLENLQPSTDLRLFVWTCTYENVNDNSTNWSFYATFVMPTQDAGQPMSFIMTTEMPNMSTRSITSGNWYANSLQHLTQYYLTSARNDLVYFRSGTGATASDFPSMVYFQDVESYYQELGYQDGYENGETTGYNNGYADGYEDGSDNGLLFTSLGVNQLTWASSDLSWDDSTDTTQTMKLFDFKDGENSSYYITLTDYSLGGGNAIVQVFKNGTASNNEYATIARGTWNAGYTQLEIIPSNYLKFEFAQITTYYHNSIPNGWFTLSGIPANATGYEVGYQTGYREGYLASPGGQATENVFSLFTNAFDSVGGIFNLKIFGFLPLYWFFLTPIFIAIIALILRLVKH